jgi:hypothetical protein
VIGDAVNVAARLQAEAEGGADPCDRGHLRGRARGPAR